MITSGCLATISWSNKIYMEVDYLHTATEETNICSVMHDHKTTGPSTRLRNAVHGQGRLTPLAVHT